MHFVHSPGARPAVVFIHGFACSHADWNEQLEHFRSRDETVAVDLRGHGASPGAPEECSIETYGADVAALLEERDLERAILVGHSMGCRVVLEAYRRAPKRVAGLVLIDGSRMATGDPAEAQESARSALAATGFPEFARKLFAGMFLADADPALKARTIEQALRLPEAIGKALFPRMLGWDAGQMDAALDAVRVPLMVIQSTYLDSGQVRVAIKPGETTPWIDLVRARVPGARIETVTGVGHFPQLETPGRVNKLLENFCAGITRRKRSNHGFADLLGLHHVSRGAGTSRYMVDAREEHFNPNGVVHGGLAFALADTGTGSALWTLLERTEGCATIEMKISYLKPATSGHLVCDSRVLHREGNLATIESEVRSGEDVIARALAVYAIFPARR
jgi:uncharacterized protein (TIGR00369 family)